MTDKQKKFVLEYMIDMNATQAAIRSGYSLRTAYSHGQRLLKNVEIQKVSNYNKINKEIDLEIDSDFDDLDADYEYKKNNGN